MSLKFKDGTTFENAVGYNPNKITVIINDYAEIGSLESAITKKENLQTVEINGTIYEHLSIYDELSFTIIKESGGSINVIFGLREKTESEIALEQEQKAAEERQKTVDTALAYLTDQQALTVKELCRKWEDDPDGYHYSMDNPEDQRRQYADGLWKLQKDHDKQASWYPGADPTLWVQIVEGHAGTLEDPIPVPDSVTTSGFEYIYGNYYSESGTVYLCQRQGVEDPEEMYGQTEKLYFTPSALVGQYFVEVTQNG